MESVVGGMLQESSSWIQTKLRQEGNQWWQAVKSKVVNWKDKMNPPPDLPRSSPPPDQPNFHTNEKWLLDEDDIEVTQLIHDEPALVVDEDPSQVASQLRLEADIEILSDEEEAKKDNLLKPSKVPRRRRSPITVQEWVASLPIHHVVQRENLEQLDGNEPSTCPQVTLSLTSPNEDESQQVESEIRNVSQGTHDTLDIDPSTYGGFRRLSATLEEMEEKANESQSEDDDNELDESQPFKTNNEEDSIQLGEEASVHFSPIPHDLKLNGKHFVSLADRRRMLLQSHKDHTSFQSDFSAKSTMSLSSVDSVLMSRSVDPSELLLDLGFGGASTSILARIPSRFFTKSHAKGISVETFLKSQEELVEKFDSGFSGYRGLSGPPDTRPSKLVEKIIERIRIQERLKRQTTISSLTSSVWSSASKSPGMKPKHRLGGFASVVNRAMEAQSAELKGARAFRAAVQSVLSPANREYMAEQARKADKSEKQKKKLVIAGKTFSIDEDDLSVVDEVAETPAAIAPPTTSISAPADKKLSKRDSAMSVLSSCSVESDWSDDELEELEKMFGNIQHKSSMAENTADPNSPENKWRNLKKSKRMTKKGLRSSLSSSSFTSSNNEAELIFTRNDNADHERQYLGENMMAKGDDRVPRRFSQQTKRI